MFYNHDYQRSLYHTVDIDNEVALKQSRQHLLCDTQFSDALNVICTALAQTAYLTKFTFIKHICGLPEVIDELQNEKTSHERRCIKEIIQLKHVCLHQ